MKTRYTFFILVSIAASLLVGCGSKSSTDKKGVVEDTIAKRMLQGVWIDQDDDATFFMVKGDTIFYPDSTSMPVAFVIINDTLVMKGSSDVKYPIEKQTENYFSFKNQVGDIFHLAKTKDASYKEVFEKQRPIALNQNQLIKRDTVVNFQEQRYRCYVQVNPTTYKVYKSSLNSDGVEVFNVYYDNIIHLSVYVDGKKYFSRDFHKKDFQGKVPGTVLNQSILNDITFNKVDTQGVHYNAIIGIPDSPSSYIVEILLPEEDKYKLVVK